MTYFFPLHDKAVSLMLHNLLFVMSLSGSAVMLLYGLIYPLTKRYFSLTWRYRILKMAIFFYLVPFSYYKYPLKSRIYKVFPRLIERLPPPPAPNGLKTRYLIVTTLEGKQLSPGIKQLLGLLMIMGIISLCIIGRQLFQYWRIRRICLNNSPSSPAPQWEQAFHQMKNDLGIKKNVRLCCSEFCTLPMTIGIWSPVIFLPSDDGKEPDPISCRHIMKHELVHIKHNDFLFNLLGLTVIAVHWFNPVSYLLYYELSNTLEMLCDRTVLEGYDEKEHEEYRRLLINLAIDKAMANGNHLFVGIINHKNNTAIKRRIFEMKTNRKHRFLLSMAAMGLMAATGSITAFAYVPPCSVTTDEGRTETFDYIYVPEDVESEEVSLYMPYDYFFMDFDGNVTELSPEQSAERASCAHSYVVSGTIKKHTKSSDGGCTVKEYEALRCSLCRDTKPGQLKGTHIYPQCPH